MIPSRRRFLHGVAGAVALPAISRTARAESYPTRPIHLILGFGSGSSSDIAARLIGQWLTDRLGQPIIIENRTGAASNLAAEAVVHAAPDGYTLLYVTTTNAINSSFYENLDFDLSRDIALIAGVNRIPNVMTQSIAHIKAGRLRALAVTTATRSAALPDVPAASEFVPGYEASSWTGVGAPRNTPADIVEKLNAEINAALSGPRIAARFAELGSTVLPGSPAAFRSFIEDEAAKWRKVIRAANLKAQ